MPSPGARRSSDAARLAAIGRDRRRTAVMTVLAWTTLAWTTLAWATLPSSVQSGLQAVPQGPIVVDLAPAPTPARDISVDTVLGIFAMAGVLLTIAVVGGVIVAGLVIVYKRRRDLTDDGAPTHTRLKL